MEQATQKPQAGAAVLVLRSTIPIQPNRRRKE
jgi:hypothetical protein